MTGLTDTYENGIHKNCEQSAHSYTTYCDSIISNVYDDLAQRLFVRVELNIPGEDTTYEVDAIWDTGATTSTISERMVKRMGLHECDTGVGITSSGELEIKYYKLDVRLSHEVVFTNMKVSAFPLEKHKIDFLIGMDIISKDNFSINNENGKTTVTFNT